MRGRPARVVAAAAITPLVRFGVHDGRLCAIYLTLLGVFVLACGGRAGGAPAAGLVAWEL